MILDGFVTFRLREYIKYLDNIIDIANIIDIDIVNLFHF